MTYDCQEVKSFLERMFAAAGFELSVRVRNQSENCFVEFDGQDTSLLVVSGGETLDAVEYIANRVFARLVSSDIRVTCDAKGYRAARESELRAMAKHALDQVRKTNKPFLFAPMSANERRVIHEALATDTSVRTESVNEGNARRLCVLPTDR